MEELLETDSAAALFSPGGNVLVPRTAIHTAGS